MGLANKEIFVFTGSYTKKSDIGLRTFAYHTETGTLRLLHKVKEANTTFLDIDVQHNRLYSTGEMDEGGAVLAYTIDPKDGRLTPINRQPAAGKRPTYVRLDNSGRYLLVANYASGNVNMYPIEASGALAPMSDVHHHSGSGPNKERQEMPHPHCIMQDAANRYVFAPDLGTDQIVAYRLDPDQHKLIPHDTIDSPAGSGPRHIAFHPNGRFAYVINELDATVHVLRYDAAAGKMTTVEIVPSLPAGFTGENTAAEIRPTADGRFLYVSNRGHDSIATFAINADDGTLTLNGHVSSGGRNPRNFNLAPDDRFLLCANQDSDNIVVFRIDEATGLPVPTGQVYEASEVVCIRFASF